MTKDVNKTMRLLQRVLQHHVGSGGMAHLPASKNGNGFMTANMVNELDQANGVMKQMPAGTDVLKLPAGNYEISGALNNPVGAGDTAWFEYHISTSDEGRRQITAILNIDGRTYYRTVHTGGDSTSGTGKWLYDPFTIWKGSANSGTIKFGPVPLDYANGVRICFRTITNQSESVDILETDGGSAALMSTNVSDDTNAAASVQTYEAFVVVTKTDLTINWNRIAVLTSGSVTFGSGPGITITSVFAI